MQESFQRTKSHEILITYRSPDATERPVLAGTEAAPAIGKPHQAGMRACASGHPVTLRRDAVVLGRSLPASCGQIRLPTALRRGASLNERPPAVLDALGHVPQSARP
jgi:hypothetical protein